MEICGFIARWEALVVLLAALAWDRWWGEPPAWAHPVVWMGHVVRFLDRHSSRGSPFGELVQGLFIALGVPLLFAVGGWWLLRWCDDAAMRALLGAWMLKSAFAQRALGEAALRVADALSAGDLAGAREGLRSLCSRDPAALDGEAVAAGAVESVAENTSDSVVAPLVAFALFGVPGALAYRAVNTLDAMIGYHGRYEYLGKASARLDDLLNLLPARVTAWLLLTAGLVLGHDAARGRRILARDAYKTESPNAGRPMAAMAGLLGVRLEKRDHYALGDPARPVTAETVRASWRIASLAGNLAASAVALWVLW